MTITHVCLMTYNVRDRTGELRQITTKTYLVKNLKHDLLSGKMLNKAGYRIILDEDPEESGIFAANEGKICKSKSFPCMDSLNNLYDIKTEPICFREFGKLSGYELWHRRLSHCTNRNIRKTVTHSTGLEDLRSRTFDEHAKCPSCMVGKSTLQVLCKGISSQSKYVHIFLFSSINQGHNYAVFLVNCNAGYSWIYGMKLKSDMLKIVKKWYSDIAILRQA